MRASKSQTAHIMHHALHRYIHIYSARRTPKIIYTHHPQRTRKKLTENLAIAARKSIAAAITINSRTRERAIACIANPAMRIKLYSFVPQVQRFTHGVILQSHRPPDRLYISHPSVDESKILLAIARLSPLTRALNDDDCHGRISLMIPRYLHQPLYARI